MCWAASNCEESELFDDEERREDDERRSVETIARDQQEPERPNDREREPVEA
jgi:hypothetical protein